jgi:mannose-6-phosphate isomerase-like protein (cupin superfamily)
MEKNFTVLNVGPFENLLEQDSHGLRGKLFIGHALGLTGCEVSLNQLPAGKAMSFVHAHKKNEELYMIIRGKGVFWVDGEEIPVQEGSLIRIAPGGERIWKAGGEDLYFICVQAEAGSLTQATREDGIRLQTKAPWTDLA